MAMDLDAAAVAIEAFLKALGHDPAHDAALSGTGARVAAMFAEELLAGYGVDVDAVLAHSVFPGQSDLVVVRDVPVVTTCPHHLMPSTGEATLAFEPDEHLVGIGTVARVIDAFARRLSLQEQIGQRTVAAFQKHLAPRWVACRITLVHACMTTRRDGAKGARVETVAIAGGDVDELVVHSALGVGR
jgi:GTP cyclohydrolase I